MTPSDGARCRRGLWRHLGRFCPTETAPVQKVAQVRSHDPHLGIRGGATSIIPAWTGIHLPMRVGWQGGGKVTTRFWRSSSDAPDVECGLENQGP